MNDIEARRTEPSKEIDLLPRQQEKLDDPDLNFLRLKVDSDMQRSVISEEEGDNPTVENNSKH